ncbi:unnamed protein product [Arctogadus glacialis]
MQLSSSCLLTASLLYTEETATSSSSTCCTHLSPAPTPWCDQLSCVCEVAVKLITSDH